LETQQSPDIVVFVRDKLGQANYMVIVMYIVPFKLASKLQILQVKNADTKEDNNNGAEQSQQ